MFFVCVTDSQCECLEAGSHNNEPECSSATGMCTCKENVEGQNCDQWVFQRQLSFLFTLYLTDVSETIR